MYGVEKEDRSKKNKIKRGWRQMSNDLSFFFNQFNNNELIEMVDDKLVRRSFWVGELACSSRAYHKKEKKN